jgi:hypothetical protein
LKPGCPLAGPALSEWICLIDALDAVLVPSKSKLQRYAHWLSVVEVRASSAGMMSE